MIAMVAFLSCCIKSNDIGCLYPCQFSFHFTKHTESGDQLSKYINTIHLYVYDKNGTLINHFDVLQSDLIDGNQLNVNLPVGEYTAIAWGGVGDSYSYKDTNSLSSSSLSLIRGLDNTLSDFPEHLFHATGVNLLVTNSVQKISHVLNFQRNSKEIKTKIRLINSTPSSLNDNMIGNITTSDIDCIVTANNGDYKFDNTTFGTDQITYIPNRTEAESELMAHFFVLKLWDGDDSRLKLTINDSSERGLPSGLKEGGKLIYDQSLSELILKNESIDLDLSHDLDLDINVDLSGNDSAVSITIKVNGWLVVDIVTEI